MIMKSPITEGAHRYPGASEPLRQEPEAPSMNATSRDLTRAYATALAQVPGARCRFPPPAGAGGFQVAGLLKHAVMPLLMTLLLLSPVAAAAGKGYAKPADKDKCPVCGMFVAKYPDWIAEAAFRDGAYAVFDGPKDLFKYLSDLKKYAPNRLRTDIEALFVMDYYAVKPIDAHAAFYVTGSDVYGPMGAELIPFEKEADAREFQKDHQGKRILRYKDITPDILKGLE